MGVTWEVVEIREIRSNGVVQLPDQLFGKVTFEDPVFGEMYHWSYEKHSKYAIISNTKLENPEYVYSGRKELHGDGGIFPIKEIRNTVPDSFESGEEVVFLASKEMLEGDVRSAYVIGKPRFKSILPTEEIPDEIDELKRSLLDAPGFGPVRV